MNIALFLEYDGSEFYGWQIQNKNGEVAENLPTVQGVLNRALSELLGEKIEVAGSSRTDAGVHATKYCASFHTANELIPPERIAEAVRHLLPETIVVKSSAKVPDEFHARFDCKGKTYRYIFYTGKTALPLLRNRAWYIKSELHINKMQKAVSHYVGSHFFDAFMAAGATPGATTERTIFSAQIKEIPAPCYEQDTGENNENKNRFYCFEVTGDGFLYNMVRIMAGTAVYAGMGKILPNDIPKIIESRDRRKAGITAPPQGLYLADVLY
ncbi:MAG: tRNA pseudouridine(38-40) synthase TruA [Ruminococcaceae bacterium]|nr:tRNA pseudouridine(38-40) synthase TruA [Oscillospiraceae bacterium]